MGRHKLIMILQWLVRFCKTRFDFYYMCVARHVLTRLGDIKVFSWRYDISSDNMIIVALPIYQGIMYD